LTDEYLDYDLIEPESHYAYDSSGNLLSKAGVTLSYAQSGNAGPHAVTSSSLGNSYEYDTVGNVITRTGTNPATFAYTSFDKPHTITSNNLTSNNQWRAEIAYGATRSRYVRKDINDTTGTRKITHYLGSVEYIYEGVTNVSTKAKRYIGNLVINIDDNSDSRNSWDFNFLLKDHIGSTHTIIDRLGNDKAQMSFNAWGQRRKAPVSGDALNNFFTIPINDIWNTLGASIQETTNRGFTGHEHFDQVGIIHMNGRIYDPTIGRFLQADPIIQDPYNTQSLNRYSYVMNNPLSYTDPTGYARLKKGAWRTIAAIAITVYTAGAASSLMSSSAAFASSGAAGGWAAFTSIASTLQTQALITVVAGGVAAGGIASGNLKGAVKGGIIAAVTFGIGHGGAGGASPFGSSGKMFAHSVVSGISAEVDGGQFGHGFASAFLSESFGKGNIFQSDKIGVAVVSNALLQGTISEATGGKFANGALSAAFRVAFNQALTPKKPVSKPINTSPGYFACGQHVYKGCWTTELEAHKQAEKAYGALSKSSKSEYGWHVYKFKDGSHTYTFATVGGYRGVDHANEHTSSTGKYVLMSTGHTHVDGSSLFSGDDVNYVTNKTKITSDDRKLYLFAPDKHVYSMSSRTAVNFSKPAGGKKISTAVPDVPKDSVVDEGRY
jgi:RHS repeat-associated protein